MSDADDFGTDLRETILGYKDLIRAFEDLRARIQCWVSEHDKELVALARFLQDVSAIDWREAERPVHEAEVRLAEFGWTIPGWMYRQDVLEVAKKIPAEIDAVVTARFMDDGANELKRLRAELLKAPALANWHKLIEEIVASIEAGHNRVAVHASLSVLEGYVAKSLTERDLIEPSDRSPISKLNRAYWQRTDIEEAYFWQSGILFLTKIFGHSDFSQDEPSLINRHWVLHGRSSKDWTAADALRLVNAISTLEHLFEDIGWPKSPTASDEQTALGYRGRKA